MKKEIRQTINRGKFIVIDGVDGSGKATQTKLLVARLKRAGLAAQAVTFPRYGEKSAGLVEEYLSGKYGGSNEVDPYQASLFYALDRYGASFKIRDWLNQGKIVIADRYIAANMGHQGGKIANPLERKLFFDWLYRLEYEILNMPRPDLNIILHLDSDFIRRLIDGRNNFQDIHEKDSGHLMRAEETFLEIAKTYPDFTIIECASQNEILPPVKINDLIWRQIADKLKISFRAAEPSAKRKMLIERLLTTAFMPTRAEYGRPMFNLYSAVGAKIAPRQIAAIRIGLKICLPKSYAGLILGHPANSKNNLFAFKKKIGPESASEIIISLANLGDQPIIIAPGRKIAQMLIIG